MARPGRRRAEPRRRAGRRGGARASPCTSRRSIHHWRWSYSKNLAVFFQGRPADQARGDESEKHLFTVDVVKAESKDITPIDGADVRLVHVSPKRPNEMLVTISTTATHKVSTNTSTHRRPDATGVRSSVAPKNDFEASNTFVGDDDLRVRLGLRHGPDGGTELAIPPQGKDEGKTVLRIPFEDSLTSHPIAFDKTGDGVLFLTESMRSLCDQSAVFRPRLRGRAPAKLVVEDKSTPTWPRVLFQVPLGEDALGARVVFWPLRQAHVERRRLGGRGRLLLPAELRRRLSPQREQRPLGSTTSNSTGWCRSRRHDGPDDPSPLPLRSRPRACHGDPGQGDVPLPQQRRPRQEG